MLCFFFFFFSIFLFDIILDSTVLITSKQQQHQFVGIFARCSAGCSASAARLRVPVLYQVVLEHVYLSVLLCVVGGAALVVDDGGGAVVLLLGGVGVEDVHGALLLGLGGLCGVLDLLLGLVLRVGEKRGKRVGGWHHVLDWT